MSERTVRVTALVNRKRVELQIGHARAEVRPDELDDLLRRLTAAALQLGEPCASGKALATAANAARGGLTDRVFTHLMMLARSGRCCPTNTVLAKQMDVVDARLVSNAMTALQRAERIRVEKVTGGRIVHVEGLATSPTARRRAA